MKFTVHTRTTMPLYAKKDFIVVRLHEEFIWLHDRFEENEEYAGYIVSSNREFACFRWEKQKISPTLVNFRYFRQISSIVRQFL